MGGIRKKKAERPERVFIEKTGKTTPWHSRQILKTTTEISVLAKEKG